MDVTTMPSTNSLLERLRKDFPAINFVPDESFEWDAKNNTIHIALDDEHFAERCLHEVGHALLKHSNYDKDIDLIALERDAWEVAKTKLASIYSVDVSADTIQDDLDTYRDWLHARSSCPECTAVGIQTKKHEYRCLACRTTWRVNDARVCSLRRYITT